MNIPGGPEKRAHGQAYAASADGVGTVDRYTSSWQFLKRYFTSREGWVGSYVRPHLVKARLARA